MNNRKISNTLSKGLVWGLLVEGDFILTGNREYHEKSHDMETFAAFYGNPPILTKWCGAVVFYL